jgi:hypothetical protein
MADSITIPIDEIDDLDRLQSLAYVQIKERIRIDNNLALIEQRIGQVQNMPHPITTPLKDEPAPKK